MKAIRTRYGASVIQTITSDNVEAVTATFYVGNEGEVPVISKTANFALVDNVMTADLTLEPEDTEIPIGEYKYQIDVLYSDGNIDKFPSPTECYSDLPDFEVYESLSDTEVS